MYLLLLAIPHGLGRRCLTVCCISSCLGLFRPVVVTMPVTRTVLPRQFGSCRSAATGSVTEVFAVLEPGSDSQRLLQLVEVRIGPPDGELPVDGGGSLARDQDPPASPERPAGSTCCQRGGHSGSEARCACPSMLSRRLPNTHNIAARSLGRGVPLVEATAREPADAARLPGRRLGAVGAEVPAVDLIDPPQVPDRTGRGGPAAARTRR